MAYSASAENGAAKSSAQRIKPQGKVSRAEHGAATDSALFVAESAHGVRLPCASMNGMEAPARLGDRRPTVRQVYALAAALCERLGEEFPTSGADASELIERLRRANGHPAPALEDPIRTERGRGATELVT
jgi:hypothetical protein